MKFNMMEVTIVKEETTAMVNAAIANLHEHYNADEFAAYQDGYEAGKKAGTFESLKEMKDLILQHIHELPTTLGYTEQIIDACIQAIVKESLAGDNK